ncbi:uncharacterized protein BDV14DRAFT_195920 [Aspergillus stella-maris]|uniref:uncharacterized protein n=1 Tax=Aspergillus stella-maris TaxID=1810926 RepID=UPI003CCD7915
MEQEAYEIGAFSFHEEQKTARVTVYVFDKIFQVRLSNESFDSSPTDFKKFHSLLGCLEGILESEDEDEEDPFEELHEWILEPFQFIFNSYLQHKSSRKYKYTFDDWLYPETISYIIKVKSTESESSTLTPTFLSQQSHVQTYHVGADLDIDFSQFTAFPIYSTKDITIDASGNGTSLPAFPRKAFPRKALVKY